MKKRRLYSLIAVVIAAVGALFIAGKLKAAAGSAQNQTQYKVTKAAVGEVKKTVSATGTLQPWRVIDIKSRAGGEVLYLGVEVGDEVRKGQVIARIDPTDTLLNAKTASADMASARAREQQSDQTYQLQLQQTQIAIRNAEADLASATASRAAAAARLKTAQTQAQAQPRLTDTQILQSKASYEQAVRQRKQLDATNPQQRAAAKAAYEQAVANRDNARLQVDRQKKLVEKGFVSQQAVDTAAADLEVREAAVTSAKAKLDTVDDELRASVESADARVAQARAALENAQANVDVPNRQNSLLEAQAALKQSDAALLQARTRLDQAKANAKNNIIRRYDVAQATASIARSEATLQNANTILQQTTVRSPSDGVVLQKYVEEGTIITSGLSLNAAGTSIVQLGDITKMYVDVAVDETDIANVDVGQKVDVTVEAYPGVPFEGKVARIDPLAKVESNVTTFHVRVEIDNSAPTFRLLRPGMNSTCEFVIDKKEGVVSVPNDAVKEDDKGRFVEVAEGGKPAPADPKTGTPADPDALVGVKLKHVNVEVGVEGNEMTEIVSGVKEGDPVVTQTIEPAPATPAAGAGGSPFGGGGGGRPGGFGGGGGGGFRGGR
jgi:HlyD family secretion protein